MQGQRWILEALPVGVWVGRIPDGQAVYANPEFLRIMGMETVADSPSRAESPSYTVFDRSGMPYPIERLPFSLVAASGEAAMVGRHGHPSLRTARG